MLLSSSITRILSLISIILLLSMDGILIEQVIVNLLENSVLHGETNDITVNITNDEQAVFFAVEDKAWKTIPSHSLKFSCRPYPAVPNPV